MSEDAKHQHVSKLKQKNRPFKGKSKGKTKRLTKGKIEGTTLQALGKSIHLRDSSIKLDRINHMKQTQQTKRAEILAQKRLGSEKTAPKIIGIVALSPHVDMDALRRGFREHEAVTSLALAGSHPGVDAVNLTMDKKKNRIVFFAAPRDTMAVIDIAAVADIVLLVMTPNDAAAGDQLEHGEDELGFNFAKVLKAQGLPSIMCLYQGVDKLPEKKQGAVKKTLTRYFHTAFEGQPKVLPAQTPQDFTQILRWSTSIHIHAPVVRKDRAYLLAEGAKFTLNPDQKTGTLSVTGFLRGTHLSANQLVHVTGFDDYQQTHIEVVAADGNVILQHKADHDQATLQSLTEIDPLAHEQSIITEEELRVAAEEANTDTKKSIQDVWNDIVSSDDDEEEADGVAAKIGSVKASAIDSDMKDDDTRSVATNATKYDDTRSVASKYGGSMSSSRFSGSLSKEKLARDEQSFPDEVDTPEEGLAKVRFQRYRGVKSFRDTEWDNRESLPLSYSQISQFEDFDRSCKLLMRESAPEGSVGGDDPRRVVLHLANVPAQSAQLMCSSQRPICVWSMLEHERQVSVLHFQVKRFAEHDPPVKMKEEMQFQLGFRRFQARPIYSNCTPQKDKSLCERFLHHSRFSVASVYARVHVGANAPVLMFLPSPTGTPHFVTSVPPAVADDRMDNDASHAASLAASSSSATDVPGTQEYPYTTTALEGETLVANGIYLGANTDRILVKRILLTGFPVGVNKRAAVVRRMFYNPDDVRWFMPVELWTKYGLVGHIKEPRGTKGLMKCIFDGFIKNHDTVCMSLYKRQFPPWAPHYFA